MKNKFIFKIMIFIIIILPVLSCDVLTKMNKTEWNEKNLEEEDEDIYFIYVAGYFFNGTNDDFFTIKFDESGREHWQRRRNNMDNDQAFGIALDDSGSVYVGGMTDNTGIGTPSDHFLLKYDLNGNEIWNIWNSLSPNWESFTGVSCDNNNIYATGYFYNPMVGDLHDDFCIMKYDLNNNLLWADIFQGASETIDERGFGITNYGNFLYIVGYSIQTGDSTTDICLLKYDISGNFLNTLYYPNTNDPNSEEAKDVITDKFGNIYIIGYRDLTGGNYDCILLKYDPSLNLIWDKIIDINIDDRGEGVAVDSAGNIYISIHSGTGPGNFDCYTIKYDQLGNETWRKQYGTSGVDDQLWDIAVDPKGNVYSVGNANNNFLIIKYDFYGNQIWIRNFNIGGFDQARAVAVGKN